MKRNKNEHFNCFGSDVPRGEALFRQTCSVGRVGVAYFLHSRGLTFASVYLSGEIT